MYKKEKKTVQCALSIGNNVLQVIASWSLMTVIRCSSRKIPVPERTAHNLSNCKHRHEGNKCLFIQICNMKKKMYFKKKVIYQLNILEVYGAEKGK